MSPFLTGLYALGSFGLVAILALAWSWYRRSCRAVFDCLTRLSDKYGGAVRPATLVTYPQLIFPHDGKEIFVSAMPSGGTTGTQSSARPAETFAQVYYGRPSELSFELRAKSETNFIEGLLSKPETATGNGAFDALFALRGNDEAQVLEIFSREIQQRLISLAATQTLRVAFSTVTLFEGGRLVLGQERPRLTVSLGGIVTDDDAVDQALTLLLTLDERLSQAL